jgi:ATP-dependent RNA helicase DDX24/MAK5
MTILERKKEKADEREARNRWKAKKDEKDQKSNKDDRSLLALIITPTRELALQVSTHINAVAKFTPIKAVPIVGGMSVLKQNRLLESKPQVTVACPFFNTCKTILIMCMCRS